MGQGHLTEAEVQPYPAQKTESPLSGPAHGHAPSNKKYKHNANAKITAVICFILYSMHMPRPMSSD